MHKDIARKLTQKLRSGNYEQGTGVLCSIGKDGSKKYCCLGVLIEVYNEIEWPLKTATEWNEDVGTDCIRYVASDRDTSTAVLPTYIQDWAGMKTNNGGYTVDTEAGPCLAQKNDEGMPFAQIADIIDANVEYL